MPRHPVAELLSRHRVRQNEIAKQLGVHINSVHQVIYGRTKSGRIAKHIAACVGSTPDRLWPGIYAEDQAEPSTTQRRRAA